MWLRASGKRYWYTLAPLVLILAVTITALAFQARDGISGSTRTEQINGVVAIILAGLAATLVAFAARSVSRSRSGSPASPTAPR